jgi:hypothetical protein
MRIHGVIVALGLTFTTGMAHAALVDLTTTGTFTNPEGPSGAVWSGVGTDTFSWGEAYPDQSVLAFEGTTASVDTGLTDAFTFGTLDFHNGTIIAGSEATAVDLTVNVDAGIAGSGAQSFDLGIINTLNTYNPWASADYVTISAVLGSADLTIDGESYVLEFLGFGTVTAGGFDVTNQFHVFEGASASAQLVGRLTPSATVPELAGRSFAAPMFLALGAIAVLTARRRSLIKYS